MKKLQSYPLSLITLLAFMTLLHSSCSRIDMVDSLESEKNNLLSHAPWKLVQIREKIFTHDWSSVLLDSCEKDDLYFYNADFTYSINRGSLACDSNELQQEHLGIWEVDIVNSYYFIRYTLKQNTYKHYILQLNDSLLVLETSANIGNHGSYSREWTYSNK